MMKKLLSIYKFLPLLLLFLIFMLSAGRIKNACYEALLTCVGLIIPSLFPFFVLSGFLGRLGLPGILGRLLAPAVSRLYGVSAAGASALMMGLLGGYPAGAAYIADMEKAGIVSEHEGERLIAFCNNSGPAFIVAVMGCAVFGSAGTGLKLYAVHIISALLTGLFFRGSFNSTPLPPDALDSTNTAGALVDAVKQAVSSILNVCGFVICFSVLVSLMETGGIFSSVCTRIAAFTGFEPQFIRALFTGVMELGSAAGVMAGIKAQPLHLAGAAAMLSWGGLSVHFQTLAVLSESKIKGTLHLPGRLLSAIFAFILMYAVALF